MGSFDVACSVSRITINPGDPVAYMPLLPYKYSYDPSAANNMLIYSWCYYEPACLPIFGEYYDYGFIDEIKEDASTKSIAKHFDCPITVVVGAEGNTPCSGMFVHRDIYQVMVDSQIDEWGGAEGTREAFYKRYETLQKAIKKLKSIPKRCKGDEWDIKFNKSMEEYQVRDASQELGFREFETFMKICEPIMKLKYIKEQMADFMCFLRAMGYANVHFFPAANGYQCGNHFGNIKVHQKTVEILNDKIEKYKKEMEDE